MNVGDVKPDDDYLFARGDARRIPLADGSVDCVVTSPPYFGLRDYGSPGQIGLEPSPAAFVAAMVAVFREVRRVLKDGGTCWVNIGDTYANSGMGGDPAESKFRKQASNVGSLIKGRSTPVGFKPKDRLGIPHRVVFALQEDGWYWRDEIVWHKPNPMPESVTDRTTKAHEMVFLLTKRARYHYDADAVAEPAAYAGQSRGGSTNRYEQNAAGMDNRVYDTRNKRSVWTVKPAVYKDAHFATMPIDLAETCIKAGCPEGGVVFDPFNGAATTGVAALGLGRRYAGIDLSDAYLGMSARRIAESLRPASRYDAAPPVRPIDGQLAMFD